MKVLAILAVSLALAATANASIECDGCKWVVGKLQGYLLNDTKLENSTVNAVEKDICDRLPKKYSALCDEAAASYLPSALEALESKYLDPDHVCDAIKMCKSEGLPLVLGTGRIEGALECKICELATAFVGKELDSNTTEAKLVDDVSKICNFFPKSLQGLCTEGVEEEGPGLLHWLGDKIAQQGCQDVHICPNKNHKQEEEAVEEGKGGIECALCDLVMGKLQSMVENSTTLDDKVEAFLEDDFCTLLPKSVQAICNATVDSQTPSILYSLADKFLNPDTDCAALGLCSKAQGYGVASNGLECTICQKIAAFLDQNVLESQKVDTFVVTELTNICNLLPKQYSAVCDAAAQQAAPQLLAMIGQFIATQGCQDLHMCTSTL